MIDKKSMQSYIIRRKGEKRKNSELFYTQDFQNKIK